MRKDAILLMVTVSVAVACSDDTPVSPFNDEEVLLTTSEPPNPLQQPPPFHRIPPVVTQSGVSRIPALQGMPGLSFTTRFIRTFPPLEGGPIMMVAADGDDPECAVNANTASQTTSSTPRWIAVRMLP